MDMSATPSLGNFCFAHARSPVVPVVFLEPCDVGLIFLYFLSVV